MAPAPYADPILAGHGYGYGAPVYAKSYVTSYAAAPALVGGYAAGPYYPKPLVSAPLAYPAPLPLYAKSYVAPAGPLVAAPYASPALLGGYGLYGKAYYKK